jgi:L-threonylcarbamoyladenylate synthase
VPWYRVDPRSRDAETVRAATSLLRASGLVVLPTDTGYALCGLAADRSALDRVYEAKGRERAKPLHVLVPDLQTARSLVRIEPRAERVIARLMPGALTLVLPAAHGAPHGLNPAGDTIGIRIPELPFTLAVLEELRAAVTATSANPSGVTAPFTSAELAAVGILRGVAAIFDAGDLPHRHASTIVELLPGRDPRLLRAGPVVLGQVLELL